MGGTCVHVCHSPGHSSPSCVSPGEEKRAWGVDPERGQLLVVGEGLHYQRGYGGASVDTTGGEAPLYSDIQSGATTVAPSCLPLWPPCAVIGHTSIQPHMPFKGEGLSSAQAPGKPVGVPGLETHSCQSPSGCTGPRPEPHSHKASKDHVDPGPEPHPTKAAFQGQGFQWSTCHS